MGAPHSRIRGTEVPKPLNFSGRFQICASLSGEPGGVFAPFSRRRIPELLLTMRDKITLACSECDRRNYTSTRNKKKQQTKLELKKFCPFCRQHVTHKETK